MSDKKLSKADSNLWTWYIKKYLTSNKELPPSAMKKEDVIDFQKESKKIKKSKKKTAPIYSKVLDLHGMTRDEAYQYLEVQLSIAKLQNTKCVLVITGKGHGKGEGLGILKRKVPLWLEGPKFNSLVKGYRQADQRDGGEGALYVFL